MSNEWKLFQIGNKKSYLLIRRVGEHNKPNIAIQVSRTSEWDGENSEEYFPTIEEIDLLADALRFISKELKESRKNA